MKKSIGIVGGVGLYAGLDLNTKILNNTFTNGTDQDHLEVYLLTCPALIEDRTSYLLNHALENPSEGIFKVIQKLEKLGANYIGIPCNTSHAPAILNPLLTRIKQASLPVMLLHIVEETGKSINYLYPNLQKIGLLATYGTYLANTYPTVLANYHLQVLVPDEVSQQRVHQAIYSKEYGIKAHSNPVYAKAVAELTAVGNALIEQGAQALIMGCTEIPLALQQANFNVPLIDPTTILARALIFHAAPSQLLPMHQEFIAIS